MLINVQEYGGTLMVIKVNVLKETEKQFKLGNTGRSVLNKTDLNKYIPYSGIYAQIDDIKPLTKLHLQKRIESTKTQLKHLTETLTALEDSLENIDTKLKIREF